MELGVYAILGVAVIVAVAAFARRLGVAAPIVLVLVGVGLSYLPGLPEIEVPPEAILDGVLPPVLYAAALTVPITDFRRNLGPIGSLSVVLVVITAFGSGFLLYATLPNLSLAAGVALGAVISPPDAVAATSIGRRLGLPPRLLTLLEGEGLVNDATALVLLRSALAAAAGALASPWAGVLDFLYAVVVALAVGLAAGIVTVFVRSRLTDATLDTAVSLIVPFVAFMPAEALHASGVLAVVVAGLFTGNVGPRSLSAQARISERINWGTVQFLLENAVFLLIGVQIRGLIEQVQKHSSVLGLGETIGLGLLAVAALVVIRYVWMVPLLSGLRRRTRRHEKRLLREWLWLSHYRTHPVETQLQARRKERFERRYDRRRADLAEDRENQIDWRGGVALGWAGMRGVVTLAAAQSLPEGIPYRPQLVLIAFTVAVVSLVVQGASLPWLIRVLRIPGVDPGSDSRQLAQLLDEVSTAGLHAIDDPELALGTEEPVDPDVVERVRQSSYLRSEAAWERAGTHSEPLAEQPHRLFRELRLAVVRAERERLAEERRRGAYPTRVLSEAQAMLDLEETRLRPPRAGH